MLSNAYVLAKFRFDTAENEPQQDVESRTKEGGTRLYFLSVTAALPLDEIGISLNDFGSFLNPARVRGTSRQTNKKHV